MTPGKAVLALQQALRLLSSNQPITDDEEAAYAEALRVLRAPLTDDQIDALFLSKLAGRNFDNIAVAFRAMVRAVEAAHGIGEES
jgi:hypothetical protein